MERKTTSGLMLTLLLTGLLTLTFSIQPVKASGTIYIRADGSIDPPTTSIQRVGNVYTFTGNIYDSIVVEKDNVVVDGAGYTIQGTGERGITLSGRSNVTIKNMKVKAFYESGCIYGIWLYDSFNIKISGNEVTGGEVRWSGDGGIYISGASYNNIISNNKVTKKMNGIRLFSSNNTVSGNEITTNQWHGIKVEGGKNNTISGNSIINTGNGIYLEYANNNNISGNDIKANRGWDYAGIGLMKGGGIYFGFMSKNNTISKNNIEYNANGIYLDGRSPSNNWFYHNNFVNNTVQVKLIEAYGEYAVNVWDDGYPSGGNSWSDYTGEDANDDGIGDTPYVIDANNRDSYPLMSPWGPPPPEPAPPGAQVGVKAGDWIKVDYTITGWPAGTPYPLWLKTEFLSVEGTSATVRVTMRMSNGTDQTATVPVDVVAGGQALGLSGFVIPANLTTGDIIFMSGYGNVTIAGETTRTYAGASRTVVYASFSQYGTQLTYYWDKQTGVMVEASMTSGGMTGTAKATETNMWEAAPPPPFWMEWWLWAIAAVVVVAFAGAVYFLKKRKPPTPTAPSLPTEGTKQSAHGAYSCHSHCFSPDWEIT